MGFVEIDAGSFDERFVITAGALNDDFVESFRERGRSCHGEAESGDENLQFKVVWRKGESFHRLEGRGLPSAFIITMIIYSFSNFHFLFFPRSAPHRAGNFNQRKTVYSFTAMLFQ